MKKILGILSAAGLITASTSSVVACGNKTSNGVEYTYLYDTNMVNNWIVDNFIAPNMTVEESSKLSDINNFDFFWSYWSDTFDNLKEKIGEDQFSTFKEYIRINLYMFFWPGELSDQYDEFKDKTFKEFINEHTVDSFFLGIDPLAKNAWFSKNLHGNIRHFEIRIKFN